MSLILVLEWLCDSVTPWTNLLHSPLSCVTVLQSLTSNSVRMQSLHLNRGVPLLLLPFSLWTYAIQTIAHKLWVCNPHGSPVLASILFHMFFISLCFMFREFPEEASIVTPLSLPRGVRHFGSRHVMESIDHHLHVTGQISIGRPGPWHSQKNIIGNIM